MPMDIGHLDNVNKLVEKRTKYKEAVRNIASKRSHGGASYFRGILIDQDIFESARLEKYILEEIRIIEEQLQKYGLKL